MNFGKCPGQDTRNWKHEDIYEDNCPNCGAEIEFWKTDLRVKCKKCGEKVVNRRFNLNCAAWCSYAEQCLGSSADHLKPESIRKKIESRVKEILDDSIMSELSEEVERKISDGRRGKANIPIIIGTVYFNAIAKNKSENEAYIVLEEMAGNGDIPPQIAEGIKNELGKKELIKS